jgi:hypothetical protein
MEAILSSETSVDARSTQRHIAEDDVLHKWMKIERNIRRWDTEELQAGWPDSVPGKGKKFIRLDLGSTQTPI